MSFFHSPNRAARFLPLACAALFAGAATGVALAQSQPASPNQPNVTRPLQCPGTVPQKNCWFACCNSAGVPKCKNCTLLSWWELLLNIDYCDL